MRSLHTQKKDLPCFLTIVHSILVSYMHGCILARDPCVGKKKIFIHNSFISTHPLEWLCKHIPNVPYNIMSQHSFSKPAWSAYICTASSSLLDQSLTTIHDGCWIFIVAFQHNLNRNNSYNHWSSHCMRIPSPDPWVVRSAGRHKRMVACKYSFSSYKLPSPTNKRQSLQRSYYGDPDNSDLCANKHL